jgi:hypothetical protein
MIQKNGAARTVVFAALAALAPLAAVALTAHADDYISPTDEHVRVSLGAMYLSSSTTIIADSSANTAGSEITAENEFGLSKHDFEPKFQATVRVEGRQRLSFDYFTLDRSGGSTVMDNPIAFRNVVFLPGDPLQTQLKLRMLGLTYEYSFWHTEKLEIAGTLGVHVSDLSAIAKVETSARHVIQTDDVAGPVPTPGLDATWVASKRFYFDGRAQYLRVNTQNLSASLGIYELDAVYRYRPNVSFALGYTDIRAKIDSSSSSNGGLFDFSSKGPEIFVRVAF